MVPVAGGSSKASGSPSRRGTRAPISKALKLPIEGSVEASQGTPTKVTASNRLTPSQRTKRSRAKKKASKSTAARKGTEVQDAEGYNEAEEAAEAEPTRRAEVEPSSLAAAHAEPLQVSSGAKATVAASSSAVDEPYSAASPGTPLELFERPSARSPRRERSARHVPTTVGDSLPAIPPSDIAMAPSTTEAAVLPRKMLGSNARRRKVSIADTHFLGKALKEILRHQVCA